VHYFLIILGKLIYTWVGFHSLRGRRGRDRMVDGFKTTCAISAFHY
jgi:hypothetical protein